MRLKQVLTGIFLVGLLFVGAGCSVVFAEFSAFSYSGEREPRSNLSKTSFSIDIEKTATMINIIPQNVLNDHISIETDSEMSPDTISFKISYPSVFTSPVGYTTASTDDKILTYVVGCKNGWYVNDPASFIQGMDEILNSLKEKKIYSYSGYSEVIIKANPELVKLIKVG